MAPGSSTPRVQGLPGITPVDGGLPIVIDGKVVGANGAAGAADLFIRTLASLHDARSASGNITLKVRFHLQCGKKEAGGDWFLAFDRRDA